MRSLPVYHPVPPVHAARRVALSPTALSHVPWPSALVAVALAQLLGWGVGAGSSAAGAVAVAGAMVVAMFLLDPGATSARQTLSWSGIAALGAGLLIAVNATPLPGSGSLVGLSVGTGVLVFFGCGALRLAERWLGSAASARLGVGSGLMLAAAAPLWLGPAGARLDLANAVVAASPLTFLSVMADYDYLHSQWFYAHSPLGSLRFAYPEWWIATLAYGAAGILLLTAAAGRSRPIGAAGGNGGD